MFWPLCSSCLRSHCSMYNNTHTQRQIHRFFCSNILHSFFFSLMHEKSTWSFLNLYYFTQGDQACPNSGPEHLKANVWTVSLLTCGRCLDDLLIFVLTDDWLGQLLTLIHLWHVRSLCRHFLGHIPFRLISNLWLFSGAVTLLAHFQLFPLNSV